jgi:lysophospholipase L1-like esterase
MSIRHVIAVTAVALAACQTPNSSEGGSQNANQLTAVSLGGGNVPANANLVPNPVPPTVVPNPPPAEPNANPNNANVVTGPPGVSATFDANGVQYLGRVAAAAPLLTWSGSGITAAFTGNTAQLSFSSVAGTNYIGITVDNRPMVRTLVTDTKPISVGNLSGGKHIVTAVKLNEPVLGSLRFNGISAKGGVTRAPLPTKRIEFIGDSITIGYGVEGTSPCTNSSVTENATATYAALTAEAVGAQYDLIAWSGKGLTRNAASLAVDNSAIIPALWTRLAAGDANSVYDFPPARTPQAVVINLGTNDFTYRAYDNGVASTVRSPLDPAAYGAAYAAFIGTVRQRYPEAVIVLCTSPMLSDFYPTEADAQHTTQLAALTAVVTQLGDAKVKVLNFPTMKVGTGLNGCESHPSAAQHQDMAALLTAQLRADLGW